MSKPLATWTRWGKSGRPLHTIEVYTAGDEPAGFHVERSDDGRTIMVWRFVGSPPIEPKGQPTGPAPRPAPAVAARSPSRPKATTRVDDLPPPGADLTAWRRERRKERRAAP